VLSPSFEEDSFEVFESKEMSEDHLIIGDRLAREDEGEREFDSVIEVESVPTYHKQPSNAHSRGSILREGSHP